MADQSLRRARSGCIQLAGYSAGAGGQPASLDGQPHGASHPERVGHAWLCRRHTGASLRELAAWLGLSRADSVPNLTRRIETRLKASPELSNDLAEILKRASSPDAGVHQANAKRRTETPRQSPRPKTKKKADTA
jgi:hypothetical protein